MFKTIKETDTERNLLTEMCRLVKAVAYITVSNYNLYQSVDLNRSKDLDLLEQDQRLS